MPSFVDIDQQAVIHYLDTAAMHAEARNDWAEGYWLGRVIEHANQNAMDDEWLRAQMEERGLDVGLIAERNA